jgi:CP family cyanate transporter-like MFS transporter
MQGGGFLIAALAPLATAWLHQWSGSFAEGWLMHLGLVTITGFLYLRFDPARYAEAMDLPPPATGMDPVGSVLAAG